MSCLRSPFRLYVNWRFLRGIEAQFLALQKGFNEVIPQHLLKAFDEKELEVVELIHLLILFYTSEIVSNVIYNLTRSFLCIKASVSSYLTMTSSLPFPSSSCVAWERLTLTTGSPTHGWSTAPLTATLWSGSGVLLSRLMRNAELDCCSSSLAHPECHCRVSKPFKVHHLHLFYPQTYQKNING